MKLFTVEHHLPLEATPKDDAALPTAKKGKG